MWPVASSRCSSFLFLFLPTSTCRILVQYRLGLHIKSLHLASSRSKATAAHFLLIYMFLEATATPSLLSVLCVLSTDHPTTCGPAVLQPSSWPYLCSYSLFSLPPPSLLATTIVSHHRHHRLSPLPSPHIINASRHSLASASTHQHPCFSRFHRLAGSC